jgi:hypothetical protein
MSKKKKAEADVSSDEIEESDKTEELELADYPAPA